MAFTCDRCGLKISKKNAVILNEQGQNPYIECPECSKNYDVTWAELEENDEEDEEYEKAEYVWRGCQDCSKWDDYYGCHDGLVRGDYCSDADIW